MIRVLCAIVFTIALQGGALAHELRPGFLEIKQTGSAAYDMRFKVPARGDKRLGLHVRLPQDCKEMAPRRVEHTGTALLENMSVQCDGGLAGRTVQIDGLSGTFTDVIARVELSDGITQAARLTPESPSFEIEAAPAWWDTAWTYFLLGVEHILLGIDHLLFVLALLLLVRDVWMLLKVITAFTVAHSITLILSALELAHIPPAPVEAVIALSIMFVAAEVVREMGPRNALTTRAPWLVAFVFGLLHGLGFGGALKEIGLPQSDVPLALLTFNLGVEAGQVLFVFAVLAFAALTRRLIPLQRPWLRTALGYGIGSVAAFWFVQRVAVFL